MELQCTQQRSPSSGHSWESNVWAFLTHDEKLHWSAHQYSHGLLDVAEIKQQINPWWKTFKERAKNITVHIILAILSFSSQKDTKLFTSILTLFSLEYSGKMSSTCEAQWSRNPRRFPLSHHVKFGSANERFHSQKRSLSECTSDRVNNCATWFFYVVIFPLDIKIIKNIHLSEFHLNIQNGIQL